MTIASQSPDLSLITGQAAQQAAYYGAHGNLASAQTSDVQAQTQLRQKQAEIDRREIAKQQAEEQQLAQISQQSIDPNTKQLDFEKYLNGVNASNLPIDTKAKVYKYIEPQLQASAMSQAHKQFMEKEIPDETGYINAMSANPRIGPIVAQYALQNIEKNKELHNKYGIKEAFDNRALLANGMQAIAADYGSDDPDRRAGAQAYAQHLAAQMKIQSPKFTNDPNQDVNAVSQYIQQYSDSEKAFQDYNTKTSQAKLAEQAQKDQAANEIAKQELAIKQQNADTERMKAMNDRGQTAHDQKMAAADHKDWLAATNQATLEGRGLNPMAKAAQSTMMNTNRALRMLNSGRPITKENLSGIIGDIGQTLTGKGATDEVLRSQGYPSILGTLASSQQYWSGNPKNALPDGLKQQLKAQLSDFNDQNKKIMNDHLDEIELKYPIVTSGDVEPKSKQKYSDLWQKIRDKTVNSGGGTGETPSIFGAGNAGKATASLPTVSSKADHDKLKSGDHYIDSKTGFEHIKN